MKCRDYDRGRCGALPISELMKCQSRKVDAGEVNQAMWCYYEHEKELEIGVPQDMGLGRTGKVRKDLPKEGEG